LLVAILLLAGIVYEVSRDPAGTRVTPARAATLDQEVAFGLHATLTVANAYGGLSVDDSAQTRLDELGGRFSFAGPAASAPFALDFHLVADTAQKTAFTIPGGQVFITAGLFGLIEDSVAIAALLAHQVGHATARHDARNLSAADLGDGLTGAIALAHFEPASVASRESRETDKAVQQLVRNRYDVGQELEADSIAIELLHAAGLDPRALGAVLRRVELLGATEFLAMHPPGRARLARVDSLAARLARRPPR
jgi:predicted Zn-dependent protease